MIEHLCRVVEEMHGLSDGHWIVNLEESSHIYLSIYIYLFFNLLYLFKFAIVASRGAGVSCCLANSIRRKHSRNGSTLTAKGTLCTTSVPFGIEDGNPLS